VVNTPLTSEKAQDEGEQSRSRAAEDATHGLHHLTYVAYFLGFLVLIVAVAVAFKNYDLQRAKYIVLLIVAAGGLAILPKIIFFLPAVQSIEIGNVKLTMKKIEEEVKATKTQLRATENFVGDLITETKQQAGLVGGSKKRSRSGLTNPEQP
jgi:hypothetical protein